MVYGSNVLLIVEPHLNRSGISLAVPDDSRVETRRLEQHARNWRSGERCLHSLVPGRGNSEAVSVVLTRLIGALEAWQRYMISKAQCARPRCCTF